MLPGAAITVVDVEQAATVVLQATNAAIIFQVGIDAVSSDLLRKIPGVVPELLEAVDVVERLELALRLQRERLAEMQESFV